MDNECIGKRSKNLTQGVPLVRNIKTMYFLYFSWPLIFRNISYVYLFHFFNKYLMGVVTILLSNFKSQEKGVLKGH